MAEKRLVDGYKFRDVFRLYTLHIHYLIVRLARWFLAVMPSSEEESHWLVGSGGGLAPSSGGSATKAANAGERGLLNNTRTGLYTEEMTTQPTSVATAGTNSASADSAEHDLIDSTEDATLLAQFHEDAIKQVIRQVILQAWVYTWSYSD